MRSAKGFCPPASPQARLSASFDIGAQYPNLGQLQPKNLCGTLNRDFGRFGPMKEADPIKFGIRVRERREALGLSQARLGKLSGYSQTNIGWIEAGNMKRPRVAAEALSEGLQCPVEYLLWATGPKQIGPRIMSAEELGENYEILAPEARAAISAAVAQAVAAEKEKLKTG